MNVTLTYEPPTQLVAGDSIEFLVSVPGDYGSWTGSARLTGPSTAMAGTVTTQNADFRVYFGGQTTPGTSSLAAGQYTLTVWATSGSDRKTIASYPLTILADMATGTPAQRHALKMLPIIEAEIEARITGTGSALEEYAIDGTSVRKMEMAELQRLRAKYAQEVSAIQNPNQGFGNVQVGFTPTGVIRDLRRRFG